jgi:ATP-binding cassette subfamily F protein uup
MTILMTLQNLSLSYPHKTIFNQVTLTLNQGDKIGVLGLNGHGKSSLFKIITGEIAADKTTPPFIYDKNALFSFFCVPQELPALTKWSIEEYFYAFHPNFEKIKLELDSIAHQLTIGEGDFDKLLLRQEFLFEEHRKHQIDQVESHYLSYLKLFGIQDTSRLMSTLSGGEQRKVALSLGFSAPQELILWDEPTNHLDLETIQLFEEELQDTRKTFMMISHDRSLLNNVVERIVHIQQGKIQTFSGSYQQYLDYLQAEQLKREKEIDRLSNQQRRETAWIRRGAKARRTKSKKRIEDYSTLNQTIAELKSKAHKSVSLNLESSGRKSKTLLSTESLSLSFGPQTLFNNIHFTVSKGDKIALMGKNGVGKSSLLKILMGELAPSDGELYRLDQLQIGHFSQKRESLRDDLTPWTLIGDGMDFIVSEKGEKRHVASYLENFLFHSDEMKRPIHTFSGGEKNRLQLAQFMKDAKDLWIFDEPTNDLDLETIGILEEELRQYEGAVIIVGHDRAFIENVTKKCWVIHDQTLHHFEAGFSQAEYFLEAIHLEEKLQKKMPASSPSSTGSQKSNDKKKDADKKRYEQLGKEIEQLESEVTKLKEQLATIDYSKGETQQSKKAAKLQIQLEQTEKKIEGLFQEWVELEALL